MSAQDTPENINITLNNLNKLLIGVSIAQSRGSYSFDESADLAETVKIVTKFLKYNNEQNEKKEKEQTQLQSQHKLQNPQLPPHLQGL